MTLMIHVLVLHEVLHSGLHSDNMLFNVLKSCILHAYLD